MQTVCGTPGRAPGWEQSTCWALMPHLSQTEMMACHFLISRPTAFQSALKLTGHSPCAVRRRRHSRAQAVAEAAVSARQPEWALRVCVLPLQALLPQRCFEACCTLTTSPQSGTDPRVTCGLQVQWRDNCPPDPLGSQARKPLSFALRSLAARACPALTALAALLGFLHWWTSVCVHASQTPLSCLRLDLTGLPDSPRRPIPAAVPPLLSPLRQVLCSSCCCRACRRSATQVSRA